MMLLMMLLLSVEGCESLNKCCRFDGLGMISYTATRKIFQLGSCGAVKDWA